MNVGYMQGTYWHTAYFHEDYFQAFANVTPVVIERRRDDHMRRLRIAMHASLIGG